MFCLVVLLKLGKDLELDFYYTLLIINQIFSLGFESTKILVLYIIK